MTNETIAKFGYPDTLLAESEHWVVLLRPQQITAGSMILACTEQAERLPEVSAAAFAELPRMTADLEQTLASALQFDKINYLLLMMVDRHVHFHVIPRYAAPRRACGVTFADAAWPKPPDLAVHTPVSPEQLQMLRRLLRSHWPAR